MIMMNIFIFILISHISLFIEISQAEIEADPIDIYI